jgi:hypothetical protein
MPPGNSAFLVPSIHQVNGAGRRQQQGREDLDERRLARAVRSEQPEELARRHPEVDAAGRFRSTLLGYRQ